MEPYSIFTFRMFVNPWPNLCHFCYVDGEAVGVVVCKIDQHKSGRRRGYLGMITVKPKQRRLGIGAPRTALGGMRCSRAPRQHQAACDVRTCHVGGPTGATACPEHPHCCTHEWQQLFH